MLIVFLSIQCFKTNVFFQERPSTYFLPPCTNCQSACMAIQRLCSSNKHEIMIIPYLFSSLTKSVFMLPYIIKSNYYPNFTVDWTPKCFSGDDFPPVNAALSFTTTTAVVGVYSYTATAALEFKAEKLLPLKLLHP